LGENPKTRTKRVHLMVSMSVNIISDPGDAYHARNLLLERDERLAHLTAAPAATSGHLADAYRRFEWAIEPKGTLSPDDGLPDLPRGGRGVCGRRTRPVPAPPRCGAKCSQADADVHDHDPVPGAAKRRRARSGESDQLPDDRGDFRGCLHLVPRDGQRESTLKVLSLDARRSR